MTELVMMIFRFIICTIGIGICIYGMYGLVMILHEENKRKEIVDYDYYKEYKKTLNH